MIENFIKFKEHLGHIEMGASVLSTAFVYKTVMNSFTKAAFEVHSHSSKSPLLNKNIPYNSLNPQARLMVAKSFAKYAAPMIVLSLVTIGLTAGRGSFSINVGVEPNIQSNSLVQVESSNTTNIESSTKSLSFLSLITKTKDFYGQNKYFIILTLIVCFLRYYHPSLLEIFYSYCTLQNTIAFYLL